MNESTVDLDDIDDTVTVEASDEMLEAAGAGRRAPDQTTYSIMRPFCV